MRIWVDGLVNLSRGDMRIYLSNIAQQAAVSESVRIIHAMIDDTNNEAEIQMFEDTIEHLMDLLNDLMGRMRNLLVQNGLSRLY